MRRVRFGAFDDGPMRPYYLLRPDGPLWNEGRTIVGQELREPAVYFAVIEQLASGEKEVGEIASALRKEAGAVSKYLTQLSVLRLVRKELPHGASPSERGSHWILDDPFLRFWFRFVFPYQADLEAGLAPMDLYRTEIEPDLADHGRWWGNARNDLRRNGTRTTEEIDIVGTARKRVTVVGEAKWTTTPLGVSILRDLEEFKIPALAQAGFKIAPQVATILYSRSGYTDRLRQRAADDPSLVLTDVTEMLSTHQ
jgi:AAA+ ATPase superfamily predicted ATPase